MSYTPRYSITPGRAALDKRLGNAAFRLLGVIGTFGHQGGWCWPSRERLADLLGVTERQVAKLMSELIELGYIERKHIDGRKTFTRVKMDIDSVPDELIENDSDDRGEPEGHPSDDDDQGGEHEIHPSNGAEIRQIAQETSNVVDMAGSNRGERGVPGEREVHPCPSSSPEGCPSGSPDRVLGKNQNYYLPLLSPSPAEKEKTKRRRAGDGERIPDDWQPGEIGEAFARKLGMSDYDLEFESGNFVDYWKADDTKKSSKRDWQAAWRTWCRNWLKFGARSAGKQVGLTHDHSPRTTGKNSSGGPAAYRAAGDRILRDLGRS